MITQIAAVLTLVAGVMIGALGIVAIARRNRLEVPAMGNGVAHRTRQAATGIALAVAICISALPPALFPGDPDRFFRTYGVIGPAIEAGAQYLLLAIVIIGVLVLLFGQRQKNGA